MYLGGCCTSPGFSTEVLHIYLALGLHAGESHPEQDEFLNVDRIPFDDLYSRCLSGEITDAKTVVSVLKTKLLLGL